MTKMTYHVHHVSSIFVYLHTRSVHSVQKQIEFDIKCEYREEYSSIDKVRSEKHSLVKTGYFV